MMNWFAYGDTKLGQGASSVKELMLDNPEFLKEVKDKVLNKLSEHSLAEIQNIDEEM